MRAYRAQSQRSRVPQRASIGASRSSSCKRLPWREPACAARGSGRATGRPRLVTMMDRRCVSTSSNRERHFALNFRLLRSSLSFTFTFMVMSLTLVTIGNKRVDLSPCNGPIRIRCRAFHGAITALAERLRTVRSPFRTSPIVKSRGRIAIVDFVRDHD